VARVREHHRATLAFLGWDIPEVHQVMDAAAAYLGARHRAVGHNLRALRAIEDLFGRRGRIIATVHILQDASILAVGGTGRTSTVAPVRRQRSRRAPQAITARAGPQDP
jgi:hypothetical protein